jgi:transcriptional regulator with XRE-family HTH domain
VDAQPRQKTQGDIARELGVSESALSSYLSGARIPSREIALRIASQCGIPLENLLDPEVAKAS